MNKKFRLVYRTPGVGYDEYYVHEKVFREAKRKLLALIQIGQDPERFEEYVPKKGWTEKITDF